MSEQEFIEREPGRYISKPRPNRLLVARWKVLTWLERFWLRDYGWTSGADTTAGVRCACESEVSVHEGAISWCKKCGRGYQVRFDVVQYPARFRPSVAVMRALVREQEQRLAGYIKLERDNRAAGYNWAVVGLERTYRRNLDELQAELKAREAGNW